MVQAWFLLHLSVGCHIFFLHLILLIIIVKCLFILAAVSPARILVPRGEKKKASKNAFLWESKQDSCQGEECWRNEEFFWCGKHSRERYGFLLEDQAARQFFRFAIASLLDGDMFMHTEVWGNFSGPFVSRMQWQMMGDKRCEWILKSVYHKFVVADREHFFLIELWIKIRRRKWRKRHHKNEAKEKLYNLTVEEPPRRRKICCERVFTLFRLGKRRNCETQKNILLLLLAEWKIVNDEKRVKRKTRDIQEKNVFLKAS